MTRAPRLGIGESLLLWLVAVCACKEQRATPHVQARTATQAASNSAAVVAPAPSQRSSSSTTGTASRAEPPTASVVRREKGSGAFSIDEVTDVAPAGPATAHELGVVMLDKRDQLLIARRKPSAAAAGNAKVALAGKTEWTRLDRQREDFAAHARGPFVSSLHAHWVSQGRLVRRRLDGSGDLEVLARDARAGTRVAGSAVPGAPVLLAYVTLPDESGTPRAKLWVEGGKSYDLTADGAGTSSVALVEQTSGYLSLALDGRSAMTPMHARKIARKSDSISLGQDVVVWVGASAQPTTEVFGAAIGDDAWALVPIEQDVLRFGLAQIHVGSEPRMDASATFTTYPNGLNSAPVAAATLCRKLGVAYAAPSSREPRARAELVLSWLGPEGLDPGEVVARARSFSDISLAKVSDGGLLVYTADTRTWAAQLRCRE